MKKFKGVDILEVWDFRLSVGSPVLHAGGKTWVVQIWKNDPGTEDRVLLEEHDTEIKTTGNVYDYAAIIKCYEWLHSVREKYSRDHIELRKPIAATINAANAKAGEINTAIRLAVAAEDTDLANQKRGELQEHLRSENAVVATMTKTFHKKVAAIKEGE